MLIYLRITIRLWTMIRRCSNTAAGNNTAEPCYDVTIGIVICVDVDVRIIWKKLGVVTMATKSSVIQVAVGCRRTMHPD